MFCMHCGKELPDDAIYCEDCGKSQNDEEKPQNPQNRNEWAEKFQQLHRSITSKQCLIAIILLAGIGGLIGPGLYSGYKASTNEKTFIEKVKPMQKSFQTIWQDTKSLGWDITVDVSPRGERMTISENRVTLLEMKNYEYLPSNDKSEQNLLQKIERFKSGVQPLGDLTIRLKEVEATTPKMQKTQEVFLSAIDTEKRCLQASIQYFDSIRIYRDTVVDLTQIIWDREVHRWNGREWERDTLLSQYHTKTTFADAKAASTRLSQASQARKDLCGRVEGLNSSLLELLK